jgi:hypothetical protein
MRRRKPGSPSTVIAMSYPPKLSRSEKRAASAVLYRLRIFIRI